MIIIYIHKVKVIYYITSIINTPHALFSIHKISLLLRIITRIHSPRKLPRIANIFPTVLSPLSQNMSLCPKPLCRTIHRNGSWQLAPTVSMCRYLRLRLCLFLSSVPPTSCIQACYIICHPTRSTCILELGFGFGFCIDRRFGNFVATRAVAEPHSGAAHSFGCGTIKTRKRGEKRKQEESRVPSLADDSLSRLSHRERGDAFGAYARFSIYLTNSLCSASNFR